jgi:hypothetical protein
MARGKSGRIVIEVEPEVKQRLYAALALSGSTLKDWFIKTASDYCAETVQPTLFRSTVDQQKTVPRKGKDQKKYGK